MSNENKTWTTYEVTVPVVVQVVTSATAMNVEAIQVDPGYGGMHGEAESNSGVFSMDNDAWGVIENSTWTDEAIAVHARSVVDRMLKQSYDDED